MSLGQEISASFLVSFYDHMCFHHITGQRKSIETTGKLSELSGTVVREPNLTKFICVQVQIKQITFFFCFFF